MFNCCVSRIGGLLGRQASTVLDRARKSSSKHGDLPWRNADTGLECLSRRSSETYPHRLYLLKLSSWVVQSERCGMPLRVDADASFQVAMIFVISKFLARCSRGESRLSGAEMLLVASVRRWVDEETHERGWVDETTRAAQG